MERKFELSQAQRRHSSFSCVNKESPLHDEEPNGLYYFSVQQPSETRPEVFSHTSDMYYSSFLGCAVLYSAVWMIVSGQAATTVDPARPGCLFNSTHCSCSKTENPGTCLRHVRGDSCLVDKCSAKGFSCDCDGTELCLFSACKAWVSKAGKPSAFLPRGQEVSCYLDPSVQCLRRIGEEEVESLMPERIEYRMVRFGEESEKTMFNMSAFPLTMFLVIVDQAVTGEFSDLSVAKAELYKYPSGATSPSRLVAQVVNGVVMSDPHVVAGEDQGAGLGAGFNKFWSDQNDINRLIKVGQDYLDQPSFMFHMHGKWTYPKRLHRRFINLRMYEEAGIKNKILCGIYNTYGVADDGLGAMRAVVTISGASGQTLEWVACDDRGECDGKRGTVLTASHVMLSWLTDGWCVKPLEWNGNVVKVRFSGVNGLRGVVMQSTAGAEEIFRFGEGHGMTGSVDKDGLVRGGTTPEIVFDLKGMELQLR
eukprot:GFKZ01008076.1.p1 GENE.GFKZ01008076.1~~GFKZ01008076.1.p1  ORF type:complete len:479 (-),score=47.46 GFKZ01008076.1:964-2400(-)